MKLFIFLCVVAATARGYYHPAPLNKDGTVADTHEVAAAKQEHYAKLADAGGATPYNHHSSYIYTNQPETTQNEEDVHRYHGPPAPLNHDGTVAETPDVKHVKQERLAALAEAFAKAPHHYDHEDHHNIWKRSIHGFVPSYSNHYHGPTAPLNHDGTVAETEEVKQAKAVHFAAHAKVHYASPLLYSENNQMWDNDDTDEHAYEPTYHGPPAPLNHDGIVAETPEVEHVKQERLAALAEAFAKAPRDEHHDQHHNVWKRSVHQFVPSFSGHYHGPPAPLNHDGTVAETEDVKEAKAVHFAAHAKVQHGTPYNHHSYTNSPISQNIIHHEHEEGHRYHGPPAPLNHDGTVAETPEVQHVKQERLAALAEAFAKAPQHYEHDGHHNKWKRSVHQIVPSFSGHYHGPAAPLNHDGTVADTEEIKAAKAVHFAAHAKVHHETNDNFNHYQNKPLVQNSVSYEYEDNHRYHGPPAPLNHDGTVAETPEVQHIKQERLAALYEAFANAPRNYDTENGHKLWKRSGEFFQSNSDHHYQGPPAPLNHDGTVAETEEVKKAKAIHFAAFSKVNYAPHVQASHHDQRESNDLYSTHEDNHRYHGPPAPLNHDGTVDETPEVKHVKAEHLATVAEAFAKAPRHHHMGNEHWEKPTPHSSQQYY